MTFSRKRLARRPQFGESASNRRGFVILVYTLSVALIILVLGLAVDAGVLYLIKNRLQAASDAGALAAARSLNLSLNPAQQDSDAQTAATNFFHANFPDSVFITQNSTINTTLVYGTGSSVNTLFLTTTATTNAPTYFMKWLGYASVPLRTSGTASRRDLNLILVLDQSGSMNNGTTPSACDQMKTAVANFVDMFANNRDTVGMVTFNSAAQVQFAPVGNFNPSIKTQISAITCGGRTGTANALHLGYQQLTNLNNPTKVNVIVLFTDGLANTIQNAFPVKTVSDTRWDVANPNNLVPVGPSGCAGMTTPLGSLQGEGAVNGATNGLWVYNDQTEPIVPAGGCSFGSNSANVRQDVAYIPTTDYWNNLTTGRRTDFNTATGTYNAGQDTFPSGNYIGKLRPDQPQTIANAAFNAVDSQGSTIRNNTTYNPIILTIGLGGNSTTPVDAEMLIRLANVPGGVDPLNNPITNTIFDATKPQGVYVYSPTSADLLNAFSKVASFLVELSK